MMLDFGRRAVCLPVFLNGAHTMRADGDDLLHFVLRQGFEIGFSELLEDQVVAQATHWISGAFFLAENAVTRSEEVHDAREGHDDLAAFGIVSAHAAEP